VTKKQYRSPLMASIHETAEGLHAAGAMDKHTMQEFDELCLTPAPRLKPRKMPLSECRRKGNIG
jgi:putative transcriptional regulator